jgi:hypothetical protein
MLLVFAFAHVISCKGSAALSAAVAIRGRKQSPDSSCQRTMCLLSGIIYAGIFGEIIPMDFLQSNGQIGCPIKSDEFAGERPKP